MSALHRSEVRVQRKSLVEAGRLRSEVRYIVCDLLSWPILNFMVQVLKMASNTSMLQKLLHKRTDSKMETIGKECKTLITTAVLATAW